MFNWFGESEHRVFNYKPRYYDKSEDERKQKEEEAYVPGSYLRGSMRNGRYSRTRGHSNKVQNIIGIIGLILVMIVLWNIAKFYTLL